MHKILLASASSALRDSLSYSLSQAGYQVIVASDGCQALQALTEHRVDLLLSTLNLPIIDGITLADELNNHPLNRFTPSLLVIDEPQAKQQSQLREMNVTTFVTIPFEIEELLSKVQKLLI